MAKRRFSGLEITLIVLFLLMFAVAVAMIVLYVVNPKSSNQGGTTGWWAGLGGAKSLNVILSGLKDNYRDNLIIIIINNVIIYL